MTNSQHSGPHDNDMDEAQIQAAIERILANDQSAAEKSTHFGAPEHEGIFSERAQALSNLNKEHSAFDGRQEDLAERHALRRVASLSTELEDVTEVEYRQLRLERVVLAGIWTEGTSQDAENSLRELAALAETAGSEVKCSVA